MSYENENKDIKPKRVVKKKRRLYAEQSHTATLLLSFFLGHFGVHRFYTGHTALGIIQLLTLGCCGIWAFIDFILICFNKFKNAENLPLREYNKTLGLTFFFVCIAIWIIQILFGFWGFMEAFMTGFRQGIGGI